MIAKVFAAAAGGRLPYLRSRPESLPNRESGVATASKGDEVIGLVRAFLIAGAARVVASLWPVDDAVTTEFMAAFYSSLRAGASPATALRSAQLEVMKTHPHPFHWAAFAVYDGW